MRRDIFIILTAISSCLLVNAAGCGPTYPKEAFKESVVRVCKDEYKIDVKVETIGRTIAIYLALPDLIDFTFSISKVASEKINDVILSVSRVALSTDAEFDFYCVIAHDVRIPEIQIVIIKSVDDVKRFLLNDISRGEYSKRMLIDIRLNPQSQKERAIKEVFNKMTLDKKWQDQVMNDFFKSEPTALGDIGYWDGRFYVKDIAPAEFLAEQIAGRIRMEFRDDKALADAFLIRSAKGAYISKGGVGSFKFEVLAEAKTIEALDEEKTTNRVFGASLKVAGHVLHGYRFENFDHVDIVNEAKAETLKVSKNDLEAFRTGKIKLEALFK